MNPYRLTVEQVVQNVKTDIHKGLTKGEVRIRQEAHGLNVLLEKPLESWLWVFIRQFQSPLIYILLIAAAIIFLFGHDPLDAFIISGVLFFNAIIGTIQEGRTRNIVESLKRFIKVNAIVIRGGKRILVEDRDLVVGDIIVLQEGQRVPSDARIIESNNVQVDESILTGESVDVWKSIAALDEDVPLGDRTNMLFKGTYILAGSATAVVVAIGEKTEIGKIHTSVEEIQDDMPLKVELNRLSYVILLFILVVCIVLFFVGLAVGKPIQELLVMLTALFICVVPEGLPVVLTLVLVTGVYRMAKKNVLVKNMQAVEALGRTNVIVIDKTGTLTRNEMVVLKVFTNGMVWDVTGEGYHEEGEILQEGKPVVFDHDKNGTKLVGVALSLLNSAEISFLPEVNLFDIKGDPTEAAMYIFSRKMGLVKEELEQEYKKLYEIPFHPKLQYHAGFYQKDGQGIAFIAGAPEVLMERSIQVDENMRSYFGQFLDSGLRVIAVAVKKFDLSSLSMHDKEDADRLAFFKKLIQDDLQVIGLCGIQDSIRPEVHSIVEQVRSAGLKVIMATGDHKKTALYVAKETCIYRSGDEVIDGSELDMLSDEQLLEKLEHITVYSRVSPQHKMRIIDLFHQKDAIVAMTGDGINDAPSLVAADLGIAMGHIGTEVAKQASDIILLDDSFVNIVNAIEQGRHIFYTLRRVILYFFATNTGEILIVLFALLLNLFYADIPLPITAAQILWLNLVTDGFLDIALSMEPKEKGLFQRHVRAFQ